MSDTDKLNKIREAVKSWRMHGLPDDRLEQIEDILDRPAAAPAEPEPRGGGVRSSTENLNPAPGPIASPAVPPLRECGHSGPCDCPPLGSEEDSRG